MQGQREMGVSNRTTENTSLIMRRNARVFHVSSVDDRDWILLHEAIANRPKSTKRAAPTPDIIFRVCEHLCPVRVDSNWDAAAKAFIIHFMDDG